jgi:hypothetical protein
MTCHERLKEGPRTKIENVVGGGGVNKKCKSHFVGRKPTSSFASKSAAFVIRRSRAGRESTLLLDRAHSLTPHKLIAKREREERETGFLFAKAVVRRVSACGPLRTKKLLCVWQLHNTLSTYLYSSSSSSSGRPDTQTRGGGGGGSSHNWTRKQMGMKGCLPDASLVCSYKMC